MTADPRHAGARLTDPQGWNGYAYSSNDPINNIDPRGMSRIRIRSPEDCSASLGGSVEAVSVGLDVTKVPSEAKSDGNGHFTIDIEERWVEKFDYFCNYSDSGGFLWNVVHALASEWTAPNTAIGIAYGLGGIPTEGIGFEDGQLQFKGNLLQGYLAKKLGAEGGAITFGEAGIYSPQNGPKTIINDATGQTLGLEESFHSTQARFLGPFYLWANGLGGALGLYFNGDWHGSANFMEQGPHRKTGPTVF